jgi:hypothetical protein
MRGDGWAIDAGPAIAGNWVADYGFSGNPVAGTWGASYGVAGVPIAGDMLPVTESLFTSWRF